MSGGGIVPCILDTRKLVVICMPQPLGLEHPVPAEYVAGWVPGRCGEDKMLLIVEPCSLLY
jgi:hypothetical protein